MKTPHLHTYQCSACRTVAVATFRARGRSLRCNLCYTPMTWLWSEPIETDQQRAWATHGILYNPGLQPETA